MAKIAIAVMADLQTHSDMARVVNALHAAKDFKEAGEDVVVFFEGGGVVSAVAIADPAHNLHRPFALVQDKVIGLCRACSPSDRYNKFRTTRLHLQVSWWHLLAEVSPVQPSSQQHSGGITLNPATVPAICSDML